ncbi:calcium-binding protein [Rhizobium sp. CRIBSB]|nr:calcium-binding protein [Rhizobium sp. CRIBSB]
MNGKTLTLAAVAASLLIGTTAGGAFAQDRGDRRDGPGRGGPEVMFVQMLQQHDIDKDGKISKEEANAAGTALFASIDADKDGVLTPGEMRQHREAMREERKAAIQAMRAEREAARANAPTPPDGAPQEQAMNGDGPRGEGKGHDGKRHGWHNERADRGGDRGGRDGMRGEGRMMRVADTDENGQISQAEATAMADRMFTRMDRNKDGFISADDMPKRPIMMR